ncbi:hypothetical protein D5085_18070 [Ectothiorhodospiraceae bacterium BW-2]|nr:hypothetical protein D5085_18070 [Ectothiorhodospiraceae bacterium BW-2]
MRANMIVLAVLLLLANLVKADTITIVADEWAPYNSVPNSAMPGYGIEIAQQAFAQAGHSVNYLIMPWNRALKETREGKYSAVIGAYIEDAPDFIFPDEEFGVSKNSFFVQKGSAWRYTGLESLLNLKVGIIQDYSFGEELDDFFAKHPQITEHVFGKTPLDQNIKKLLAGRVDVLVEDSNVFMQKVKEMGVSDKIEHVGDQGDANKLYIAFSPALAESKTYADILSKGIVAMKKSGELEQILAKYGLSYWK